MSDAQGFVANNGTISVTDLETALATIEKLTHEQEFQKSCLEQARAQRDAYVSMLADAKLHLEAYLDIDDIEVEDGTDLEALCSVLDVQRTQEVEVTISMSWVVTVTIPAKYEAEEWVQGLDVSIEEPDFGGAEVDFILPGIPKITLY